MSKVKNKINHSFSEIGEDWRSLSVQHKAVPSLGTFPGV